MVVMRKKTGSSIVKKGDLKNHLLFIMDEVSAHHDTHCLIYNALVSTIGYAITISFYSRRNSSANIQKTQIFCRVESAVR